MICVLLTKNHLIDADSLNFLSSLSPALPYSTRILRFLLRKDSAIIEREIASVINQLNSNSSALYITELLSIASLPLAYIDKNLHGTLAAESPRLAETLNKYLFNKIIINELTKFISACFIHLTANSKGKNVHIFTSDVNILCLFS